MSNLYNLADAAKTLGGISVWTLRKHIALGKIAVTRLGRRVFLTTEEIERVRREGLPSLRPEAGSRKVSVAASGFGGGAGK